MNNEWFKGPSNFVCAGGDCFVNLMENFIDKYNGNEYFDDEKLNTFILDSIDKYLYSYGTGLSYKTKKISPKHNDKISSEIDKIINRKFMKNSKLYIDSGGFQVAMGAINSNDMPLFISKYHQFLIDNHQKFTYAFGLDLPPGPSSALSVFESYNQIEELNRLSYKTSVDLPQNIKDKMIYIHHFRTPSLYDSWSKFLWDENLAEGFKNFATGGIVANMATDLTIPVIIYSIPLSEVLKYVISKNMRSFNFHVLGGANYIDVFYHKLFSYHILKVHNIKVNITYDSSAIFKALAIGRFMPVFNQNNNLLKMDLKSNGLHLRFDEQSTKEDKIYHVLNKLAAAYNFKQLSKEIDPIYDLTRNTFSRSAHMYLICYVLRMYRTLELICEQYIEEIYPLYEQNKQLEFDGKCYEIAKRFNQGKIQKNKKQKLPVFINH